MVRRGPWNWVNSKPNLWDKAPWKGRRLGWCLRTSLASSVKRVSLKGILMAIVFFFKWQPPLSVLLLKWEQPARHSLKFYSSSQILQWVNSVIPKGLVCQLQPQNTALGPGISWCGFWAPAVLAQNRSGLRFTVRRFTFQSRFAFYSARSSNSSSSPACLLLSFLLRLLDVCAFCRPWPRHDGTFFVNCSPPNCFPQV